MTEQTHAPEAGAEDPHEMTDEGFAYDVTIGALLGIPITFVVIYLVISLGTGRTAVAPAMVWTALVGGGYFGGFLALNLALGKIERAQQRDRRRRSEGARKR